ncbi:MAG: response regulator [Acidobacteriota bacterium]
MRAFGHIVEVARDAPAALTTVKRFRPDVALLDLGLPIVDGFELAERLPAEPGLHSLRLIAVTGYAQESDRRETAAQGFDGHLAKPIDVHDVDALLRSRSET